MLKKIWIYSKNNSIFQRIISLIYSLNAFKKKRIKGKNNYISYNRAFLKNINLEIIGNGNRVLIHSGVRLKNTKIFIRGCNNIIEIGENCTINKTTFWVEDNKNKINIGNDTSFGMVHMVCNEGSNIIIGEDCMFSHNIEISTGDSHSIIDLNTGNRINPVKNIVLKDHVWVGAYSKILKGVVIKENSIIGMGSVVTKNVENNVIVVGIPAKEVKKEITWSREKI